MQTTRERAIGRLCEEVQELSRQHGTKHGMDFLKEFVKNTKQYVDETNTDKQEEMLKGLYARWTAYMLMKNSNQGKYGSLVTSLTTQF
jgi:hypothetical protein